MEDGDSDKELRPLGPSLTNTIISHSNMEFKPFEIELMSHVRYIAFAFRKGNTCYGWNSCSDHRTVESYEQSQMFTFKLVQKEVYSKKINTLNNDKRFKKVVQLHR